MYVSNATASYEPNYMEGNGVRSGRTQHNVL